MQFALLAFAFAGGLYFFCEDSVKQIRKREPAPTAFVVNDKTLEPPPMINEAKLSKDPISDSWQLVPDDLSRVNSGVEFPLADYFDDNQLSCIDSYPNGYQPRALLYHSLDELMKWQSEMGVDGGDAFLEINVATEKLRKKIEGENLSGLKIALLDDRGPDSAGRCFDGATQGAISYQTEMGQDRTAFPRWVFNKWAYIDIYVFFNHAMFSFPPAVWTNAAHKNGVLSLGTIIFENDTTDQLNQMVRDRKVSQKLIDIAGFYGFDGYFINFESEGAVNVSDTIAFIGRLRDAGLYVQWYDSVTINGSVSYQNALDDENKPFFEASSSIFTNYWWMKDSVISSHKEAGARYLDVFMGVDGYARSINPLDKEEAKEDIPGGPNQPGELLSALKLIIDDDAEARTSMGVFAPAWTFFKAEDPDLLSSYLRNSASMWLSKGVGSLVEPNSAITSLPFLTHFNTGQGTSYYYYGEKVSSDPWNHLSQQDVPLTFMYDDFAKPSGAYAKETYDAAYLGGSSLAIYGEVDGEQIIDLFKTDLDIEGRTVVSLVTRQVDTIFDQYSLLVHLQLDDGRDYDLEIEREEDPRHGDLAWKKWSAEIPRELRGSKITKLSLKIKSWPAGKIIGRKDEPLIYVGEFKLAPEGSDRFPVPHIAKLAPRDKDKILSWRKPHSPYVCKYYDVFGADYNYKEYYLGRAYTNHYGYGVNLIDNSTTGALKYKEFSVSCVNQYGNHERRR